MNSTLSPSPKITIDDPEALFTYLPERVVNVVRPQLEQIDEIKMRFERPLMILKSGVWQVLEGVVIDQNDLSYINAKVQGWRDDGRKGVSGTCHRLSRISSTDGSLEGVTARIGRFVTGVAEPLRPFLEEDPSMLLLGGPGTGKSTTQRDTIRILADTLKAFCIVIDTSGELSGDGKKAHPGIGHADRLSVPSKKEQASIIEQAMRNHTPRVLVVDEIGYDALEVRVITEASKNGVKLVATTHGKTFEDLMEKELLRPLLEPKPIFRWLTVVVSRGVNHVYDLPVALERWKKGLEPEWVRVR
jgi:stage III sporulation protein SpoIIIAA